MGGMALATFLPQLPAESPPEEGDCPTCVGGLNDTLGSCGSSRACKSSYDDSGIRGKRMRLSATSPSSSACANPSRSHFVDARAAVRKTARRRSVGPLAAMAPETPSDPARVPDKNFSLSGSIYDTLEQADYTDLCLDPYGEDCQQGAMPYPLCSVPPLDPDACTLRIFAINDVYILDHYPHMKACIDAHANGDNTIVTLAGDFLAPSLLSGLDQGHGCVDVMNATGLTHVCFGNHECDVPFPDMLNRIKESRFKWISTNMALPTDSIPPLPEWDVITVRGGGQERRVGLLGLLTEDPGLYRQGSYGDAVIEPVAAAFERAWGVMSDMGVDAVIPMTHQDMPLDVELAKQWGPGGARWQQQEHRAGKLSPLRVILGGHDHEVMYERHAGCKIIKAGAEAEYIAVVDVIWETPETTIPQVRAALVDAMDFLADPQVSERVAGHYQRVDEVKRAPLCPVPAGVKLSSKNSRFQQTTVGSLLCSAMRDGFLCDGCLFNGGGIRSNRDYPDDTEFFFLSDLEAEMPFNNELVCVEMPGRVVSDIVAYTRSGAFKSPAVEYGGFMQMDDEMRFCEETMQVTHIRNEPIDMDATYSIVVTLIHLQGIDNIKPMKEFAKTLPFLPNDGIPCKMVIVNYFSRLMWLMMGGWSELNSGSEYVTRDDFINAAKAKFDPEFVVDQVFNKCDLDGDGRVSKVDMVASVLFTGYLYDIEHNGVLNRQQVHDFAERVLGCPVEDELVDQIMSSYDLDGSGLINVHEMRRASHPGVIAEQVVV